MLDALTFYRVANYLYRRGMRRIPRAITKLSRLLFTAHVEASAEIGDNCTLGWGGMGVIIHPQAHIGNNVVISTGVVIGGRSELEGGAWIDDDVKIGVDAKILGPVRIGAGAMIGANAVVIDDVPPGVVVAGVPARPIRKRPASQASEG